MSRLYYYDDWDYNVDGLQQGWLRSAIRNYSETGRYHGDMVVRESRG